LAAARENIGVLVDKAAAVTIELEEAKYANAGFVIAMTSVGVALSKLTTECDEKETRLKSLSIERDAAVALAVEFQTQAVKRADSSIRPQLLGRALHVVKCNSDLVFRFLSENVPAFVGPAE
jgi:hypothetical protein